MSALWTGGDVARATGGEASAPFAASGVSIDSRTVAPGDLFVALRGPNFDGHDHVDEAMARGAAGALVSRRAPGCGPRVRVRDTLAALAALGRAGRDRAAARVVAITGSVGKTGVKAMCARALGAMGRVHASEGNLNNHIGLPLSLARLHPSRDFAVLEMGMNRPGEIRALAAIARPHVAAITAIAPAHMEFFPDLEAVAAAKAEIFEGAAEGAAAVLNRDDPSFDRLAAAARAQGVTRILGFGAAAGSCARLVACDSGPEGSRIRAEAGGEEFSYTLGVAGRHWAHNSLAALAAVRALGGDAAACAARLEAMPPLPGRGRRFPVALAGGAVEIIDDAYNASPASMKAAFELLALVPACGRRIAALGDMLELGAAGEPLHRALAGEAARAGVDLVFTAGPLMAAMHAALPKALRGGHAENAAALAPRLCAALRPGDAVLVKGSHGSGMHGIVAALESSGAGRGEGADAL